MKMSVLTRHALVKTSDTQPDYRSAYLSLCVVCVRSDLVRQCTLFDGPINLLVCRAYRSILFASVA